MQPEPRLFLRPIANPLPLGFLALAAGTLVVAGLQLGWLQPAEGHDVALILIAFVFPLQLLTSVFGYLARDVVAGTAMGILAGTWLSIALVVLTNPPGSTSDALGLFLLVAGAAMLVPASAAFGARFVPFAVLTTAGLRFALTGVYELTAGGGFEKAAAWVGLALCALGLYAALAMELEEARGKTVLPVLRVRRGRAAIESGLPPGVREQL
jgi:succinate-acetate transporter protein